MTRFALILLALALPFLAPSDSPAPPLSPRIFDLFQIDGSICTDGQSIVNNNGAEWVCGDPGATTTSGAIIDIGDDGINESTGMAEIATTGDTAGIFTESAPDKFLINVAQPWPTASALAADGANCSAGEAAGGVDTTGAAQACVDPILETELDTEAKLEAQIADVNNIFTSNDGALDDDDLTDDLLSALQNVNIDANAANDGMLIGDGTEYRGVALPGCSAATEKMIYDTVTNTWSCQTDANDDDLSDDLLSALQNVNADANATDHQMVVGDGTEFRGVALPGCNPTTQKMIYNQVTHSWSCETDGGGEGTGGATTEEELESNLTDVSDVFTSNDGSLEDDDLTDNPISDLQNVDAGVSGVNHQMIVGNGSTYQGAVLPACAVGSQKYFYNQASRTWTCEADVTSATQGLDGAFDVGKIIDGANSEANAAKIGDGTDAWEFYCELGTCFQKTTNPSDTVVTISTDKVWRLDDEEGGEGIGTIPMLTIDPDAATPNEKYRFENGHELLASAEVVLRPAGDCVVAEESPVAGESLDEWITCADTTGDSVAFSYRLTGKVAADTTAKITLLARNENATPAGTFTLACAAQSVRPGLDAYTAHNTTGQQNVSWEVANANAFDTQSRPEEASATFTVNGTVATGAHIKGQCNVTAAPAQIADIRLHASAVIELSANSWSD